jgi:hypothetical protein
MKVKNLLLICLVIVGAPLIAYALPVFDLSNNPGTLSYSLALNGAEAPKADLLRCFAAASNGGWVNFKNYLGVNLINQKVDISTTADGKIQVGADQLNNCESLSLSLTDGTDYYTAIVLNKWGHIWFRVRPAQ